MRSIPTRAWLVGLFAFTAFGGCADLSEMEEGFCGNGVVESAAGEDCDLYPSETCIPPGERNECRLSCEPDEDDVRPDCPVGWGCGSDDVCRQPDGTFDEQGWFPLDDTPKLAVGDVDGDGRADLVSVTLEELFVSFFDTDANVIQSVGRYSAPTTPVVGQLTAADSPDDVVLLADGMTVLVGSRDRSLRPTAYAPFALGVPVAKMVVMEAMPHGSVDDQPGKWAGEEIIVLSEGWARYIGRFSDEPLVQVGTDGWAFAGDPSVGKLNPQWPCEDLIIALEGEGALTRYNPCAYDQDDHFGWNHSHKDEPISLPAGMQAATRALLVDLNADELLDVIVGVAPLGTPAEEQDMVQPVVAYAVGDGTFDSRPSLPPADPPLSGNGEADFLVIHDAPEYERASNPPMPLAVGDVNGDGSPDYVMPDAVLVSVEIRPWDENPTGKVTYGMLVENAGYPWNEGVIADFNANGHPDVMVASSQDTGIVFYNGTGTGLFNEFWLQTTGYPAHFTVGDFDGDLVQDLAFAETGLESEDETDPGDALSVVFGSGYGGPNEPVTMGYLGRIDQIDAGSMAEFHLDDIDDLLVVSRPVGDPNGNLSAAALGGASNRQLLSPFVLSLEKEDEKPLEMMPWLVSLGEFDGDTSHADFAALGVLPDGPESGLDAWLDFDVRLWLAPSKGEAQIDSATDMPSASFPEGFAGLQAATVPIDLTGDGIDEVVVFGPKVSVEDLSVEGQVFVARSDGASFSLEDAGLAPGVYWQALGGLPIEAAASLLAGFPFDMEEIGARIGTHAAAGDVEGDEREEIVVLAFRVEVETATTSSHLQLVRQDGQGGLDMAGIVNLTDGVVADPTAMTLVNLDSDPQLELVFVTAEAAYRADVQDGVLANVAKLDGVSGGYSVAAADFTGDGIVDLAVGDYGVTTYKGNAVNP